MNNIIIPVNSTSGDTYKIYDVRTGAIVAPAATTRDGKYELRVVYANSNNAQWGMQTFPFNGQITTTATTDRQIHSDYGVSYTIPAMSATNYTYLVTVEVVRTGIHKNAIFSKVYQSITSNDVAADIVAYFNTIPGIRAQATGATVDIAIETPYGTRAGISGSITSKHNNHDEVVTFLTPTAVQNSVWTLTEIGNYLYKLQFGHTHAMGKTNLDAATFASDADFKFTDVKGIYTFTAHMSPDTMPEGLSNNNTLTICDEGIPT